MHFPQVEKSKAHQELLHGYLKAMRDKERSRLDSLAERIAEEKTKNSLIQEEIQISQQREELLASKKREKWMTAIVEVCNERKLFDGMEREKEHDVSGGDYFPYTHGDSIDK